MYYGRKPPAPIDRGINLRNIWRDITSFVTLDQTLGKYLPGAQNAASGNDPAQVILGVLAKAKDVPTDAVRAWLRSRGSSEVRALVASASTYRSLVASSEWYRANNSPEAVRALAASKVVSALAYGLRAPEAALIALIAIDQMESGIDRTLLTQRFSVQMRSTQTTLRSRTNSLVNSGFLKIAYVKTGVPTKVRLRSAPPAVTNDVNDAEAIKAIEALEAFRSDLATGRGSALTELFFAVRSPALAYTDLGYDAWYCALLDALGLRKRVLSASRSSRARSAMRSLAGTEDLLTALRILETPSVLGDYAAAEHARQVEAQPRGESARFTREAKDAARLWLESIAPIPGRTMRDESGVRHLPTRKLQDWVEEAHELADTLDNRTRRYACDDLERALRKRQWDERSLAKSLDGIFPDRGILRWVALHGRLPGDPEPLIEWVSKVLRANGALPDEVRDELVRVHSFTDERIARVRDEARIVQTTARFTEAHGEFPVDDRSAATAWLREVRTQMRDADAVHLREYVVRHRVSRATATELFPDHRLDALYEARGAVPPGSDHPAVTAWVRLDAALAPRSAEETLRFDLATSGWGAATIDAAVPRLLAPRKV